jgi:putative endonuclease
VIRKPRSSGSRTSDDASPRALPAAYARGREAETIAGDYLTKQGFRILWRNLRIGALEIDLVAKKEDLAIVVEVRTRGAGAFEKPLASVSRGKQQMLLRAARGVWRGRLSKMPDVERMRIDVIAVTFEDGTPRVEWIRGAITE